MGIPEPISRFLRDQAARAPIDVGDLRVVVFNGTLKRSPETSHTDGLLAIPLTILRHLGVRVDVVRTIDHVIPPGVQPDMREHGWERDDFPDIYRRLVLPADVVVLATPIWLGDVSSPTRLVVERLYGWSGETNDRDQWVYYGKVGGAVVTGNEDGAKHCAGQLLYALQHIGFAVPPAADAYWVGDAGPGPSYLDEPGGGQDNAWTTRNAAFMTWNLLHLARMLKDAGGFPAYGNRVSQWDLSRPEHPNPASD